MGSFPAGGSEHPKEDLEVRLKKLTHAAPCMLFMKGTPQEPRCGKTPLLQRGCSGLLPRWGSQGPVWFGGPSQMLGTVFGHFQEIRKAGSPRGCRDSGHVNSCALQTRKVGTRRHLRNRLPQALCGRLTSPRAQGLLLLGTQPGLGPCRGLPAPGAGSRSVSVTAALPPHSTEGLCHSPPHCQLGAPGHLKIPSSVAVVALVF